MPLGFWYPYKNIFKLVEELELKPFTKWMSSAIYSEDGLEVTFSCGLTLITFFLLFPFFFASSQKCK